MTMRVTRPQMAAALTIATVAVAVSVALNSKMEASAAAPEGSMSVAVRSTSTTLGSVRQVASFVLTVVCLRECLGLNTQ